jgi:predicted Zn-dependent protease with MMP-like domain
MEGEDLNPLPGQILLFLENIWSYVEGDLERYREEVTVTLLHELGHYLGLDEQDMFDRGLD